MMAVRVGRTFLSDAVDSTLTWLAPLKGRFERVRLQGHRNFRPATTQRDDSRANHPARLFGLGDRYGGSGPVSKMRSFACLWLGCGAVLRWGVRPLPALWYSCCDFLLLSGFPITELEWGGTGEMVMAKVIEFYIPKDFRKTVRRGSGEVPGRVIEFCLPPKKSA
jgi:hypothetical protein